MLKKMKKFFLLLVIAIIILVAISASIFSLTVFKQTTEVDTYFISGTIQEKAYIFDDSFPDRMITYDSKNTNRYIFGMADSLKLFSEFFEKYGAKKIATQTYNGIEWNIYFINPIVYNSLFNEPAYAYLCVASGKNGDYYIEVSSLTLEADESLQSKLFTKYTKPLLESIKFKDPENVPKEYQLFDDLGNENYDYIKEYGWDSYFSTFK